MILFIERFVCVFLAVGTSISGEEEHQNQVWGRGQVIVYLWVFANSNELICLPIRRLIELESAVNLLSNQLSNKLLHQHLREEELENDVSRFVVMLC